MKKTIFVFGLAICFFSAKAQDSIWLKSGKTVEGQILSFTDNTVGIQVDKKTSVYKLAEVKSLRYNGPVERASTPVQIYIDAKGDKNRKTEMPAGPVKIEQ